MTSNFSMLVSRKDGFIKRTTCVLCFFDDEIVVKAISNEEYQKLIAEKKEGKGFFKAMGAAMSALTDYADEISDMNYDELIGIGAEAIKRGDIVSLKFRKANSSYNEEGTTSQTEGKLIIKTNDKKIVFMHRYEKISKEEKEYFKSF